MSKPYCKITIERSDGFTASTRSLTWYSKSEGGKEPSITAVLGALIIDDDTINIEALARRLGVQIWATK